MLGQFLTQLRLNKLEELLKVSDLREVGKVQGSVEILDVLILESKNIISKKKLDV